MRLHHRKRPGFTLIELLAVIAIVTLLAALTAAGIQRVRSGQMARNTEGTVTKLQLALDQQWQATVAMARDRKSIPAQVLTACNNDVDLAAAAWAYMQTRREFPNTFTEATTPVSGPGGYSLPARTTFSSCNPPATSLTDKEQAAALLYLILSEKGTGGASFNADEATRGAQQTINDTTTSRSFRVFVDAWGTPITFIRYASGGLNGSELNSAPFVNPAVSLQDPLDPRGKLQNWSGNSALSGVFGSFPGGATAFNGKNRQPAVISAGANKDFEGMFDMDNVVGYRLRRQGDRGD